MQTALVNVLCVGAGGFLGSIFRFGLSQGVQRLIDRPWMPYGTMAANLLGCLLIGFLLSFGESRQVFGPQARLFLFVGLLGGFTTFSTYEYESFAMMRDGQLAAALTNLALQLVVGFAAVWLGHGLGRTMGG